MADHWQGGALGFDAAPTILVVEDEPLIRLIVAQIVHEAGFPVIEAANATEAIYHFRNDSQISLMLSDVRMPGLIDGLGLARMVRAGWPDVKIIILSGRTAEDAALACGDVYIVKPFDPYGLIHEINGLLRRSIAPVPRRRLH